MIKTAEFVSPAHPDKLCDQISDMILTECLKQDKNSRVAIETAGGHGHIHITGELTTNAKVDLELCARSVLTDNRYNQQEYTITTNVVQQSSNIASGVDTGGAGDQGIMVGYATNETEELMPLEYQTARDIIELLRTESDKTRDAKSQVTIQDGKITDIVISAERLTKEEIEDIVGMEHADPDTRYHINPCGYRDNGGFEADAGVTGRKLAVDNYGPQVEIGGGAFSGKDYTKVDRSGAYMARKIAVDYLGDHKRCKVKLAYCIGKAEPLMVSIETDKGYVDYKGEYDLTPKGIRELLHLSGQDYYNISKWGHFGRGFIWDK